MNDEVQASAAKAKRGVTKEIITDFDKGTVTWVFKDGQQLTCEIDKLHENVKRQVIVYGFKQKICDAYSGNTGPGDAFAKAHSCRESLYKGVWTQRGDRTSILVEAISRVKPCTVEEAQLIYAKLDTKERSGAMKDPRIAVVIADIQKERAEEALETADLSGLDAIFG